MGGLGKTTLARKVYNSDKVKKHFNCRVWVYISNECRTKELLLGLLQNLMSNHDYESRSSNKIKKKGKKKHDEAVSNSQSQDISSLSDDELNYDDVLNYEAVSNSQSQDISSLSDDELKKRVWECLK
ncbi:disease resistance protein, partial [Trifolium medium]|nr:disease resistance protein [Trifolium medium]